jgi:hypothetical protein
LVELQISHLNGEHLIDIMKLITFKHREDFGHDLYIILLQVKRWCLVQSCFSTIEYSRSLPYFNLTMGSGRLISVSFQIWIVGFTIELVSRSWFNYKRDV